jgi:tetratricopeptide (TPR) repeat protein
LSDVLAVQDAIAIQVASSLEPELLQVESSRPRPKPDTSDAMDYVFRAYAKLWQMSDSTSVAARADLRTASSLNPGIAQPHLGLAMAALFRVYMGWSTTPEKDIIEARKCAARAIELDREDAWAHMALGIVGLQMHTVPEAMSHLKHALQLNPSLALAYGFLGNALIFDGHHDAGAEALQIALRLSPRDLFLFYWYDALAMSHILEGRFEDAVRFGVLATKDNPKWPGGFRMLAVAHGLMGDTTSARAALNEMLQLQHGFGADYLARIFPFRLQNDFDRILAGLRRAGWE